MEDVLVGIGKEGYNNATHLSSQSSHSTFSTSCIPHKHNIGTKRREKQEKKGKNLSSRHGRPHHSPRPLRHHIQRTIRIILTLRPLPPIPQQTRSTTNSTGFVTRPSYTPFPQPPPHPPPPSPPSPPATKPTTPPPPCTLTKHGNPSP